MRSLRPIGMLLAVLALSSCQGSANFAGIEQPGSGNDKYAPCTDEAKCCPKEQQYCLGDVDNGGMTCTCVALWECSENPQKCDQAMPTPNGDSEGGNSGGGNSAWECTWTASAYTCTLQGGEQNAGTPPEVVTPLSGTAGGTGSWSCKFVHGETGGAWECTRATVPNPTNVPEGTGVWTCDVDNEMDKLSCTRTVPPTGGDSDTTTPDTGSTTSHSPTPAPTTSGTWVPVSGSTNGTMTKTDDNKGLPVGGGNWKCNLMEVGGKNTWVCYGEFPTGTLPPGVQVPGDSTTPGTSVPGGSQSGTLPVGTPVLGDNGWTFTKMESGTSGGNDVYKAERPEGTPDQPPGGGWFSCVKGSEFNGTQCTPVDSPPTPPNGVTPQPGQKCEIGEKMWCDGPTYCGWGQVICDQDTGTWATVRRDGREVLDCKEEIPNQRRPNTVCACYYTYFNPACCERPDCIVPAGTNGQICAPSAGELCDYCNAQHSECKKGQCVIADSMETYCGQDCSGGAACPTGYTCKSVKAGSFSHSMQCVPTDGSCFR